MTENAVYFTILAFLTGSLPVGRFIISKFMKNKIKSDPEFNNPLCTRTAGMIIILADLIKGFITASYGADRFASDPRIIFIGGLALIAGRVFPVFSGFKGGKGYIILAGFFAALIPFSVLIFILTGLAVYLMTKDADISLLASSCTLFFISLIKLTPEETFVLLIIIIFIFSVNRKHIRNFFKKIISAEKEVS